MLGFCMCGDPSWLRAARRHGARRRSDATAHAGGNLTCRQIIVWPPEQCRRNPSTDSAQGAHMAELTTTPHDRDRGLVHRCPSPIPANNPHLIGTRCTGSGTYFFPPERVMSRAPGFRRCRTGGGQAVHPGPAVELHRRPVPATAAVRAGDAILTCRSASRPWSSRPSRWSCWARCRPVSPSTTCGSAWRWSWCSTPSTIERDEESGEDVEVVVWKWAPVTACRRRHGRPADAAKGSN